MSWISLAAISFIVWWLVLFAVLPFSLRTQDEHGEVTPGSVPSAPHGSHVPRAMLRATIVTAIIMAAYYFVSHYLGYGFDDIPRIAPEF